MTKISFGRLPFIVQLATMLAFLAVWVEFEEFGIDRYGLDRYLPYYRVGNFCVYDFTFIAALIVRWIVLARGPIGRPSCAGSG